MLDLSPVPKSDFAQAPDLNDPLILQRQCEEWADGVQREGESLMPGSLMGGHPSRPHFFAEVAKILRAAGEYVKKTNTPSEVKKEETTPVKQPEKKPVVGG